MGARFMQGTFRLIAIALLGLGGALGCSHSSVATPTVYHPTLVQVSPDQFLGSVACRPNSIGALKTYVATVFDLGTAVLPTEPFALPSSPPVSCLNAVAFSRVDDPHLYRAEIQGYDRDDLLPLGSDDPKVTLGIPILVDPTTKERVSPRWTTTCGETTPARARSAFTRTITDCAPLVDSQTLGPATVSVSLDGALGTLECGSEPGMVDRFEVVFGEEPAVTAACGETVTLDNVPPNGTLTLSVVAYAASDSSPTWGSTCTVRPVAGATVPATCSPLDDQGALDVNPADALNALGEDCSALGELRLELLDEQGNVQMPARFVEPGNCNSPVRFSGIVAGSARVRATLLDAGAELGKSECHGSVIPGQAVTASCTAVP
jgi:hypothetical protein